ncbi:hypothetical protein [Streptomyces jumonjinensis]|uniref:Uncharacterized protein n=1 Tax=Streptomyces jumonjinensis TaxID=1945 RepID=A0A646KP91_STRJU|nr:hypothetical protein [Streptomyces jumonjinensis]MQT03888.1 hypothetical protein [Streptomyces jumonjinensis]
MILPHIAYAEAVYADLAGADVRPALIELRTTDDLDYRIRLQWAADHHALTEDYWPHGLHLAWSSIKGWSASGDRDGDGPLLPGPVIAAPDDVTAFVFHICEHGPAGPAAPAAVAWTGALALTEAMNCWEDQ